MAALAKLYRELAARMVAPTGPKLVGDLFLIPMARRQVIGDRLEAVRLVFEDETATLKLPEDTDAMLTADHKAALSKLLSRFANLFEEASK